MSMHTALCRHALTAGATSAYLIPPDLHADTVAGCGREWTSFDQGALEDCAARKIFAQYFALVYLYYAFDQRPAWCRGLWRVSDVLRRLLSRAPDGLRYAVSQMLALGVYCPLARGARYVQACGFAVDGLPLSAYRDKRFYTMRTDALDRFGTRVERRFTRFEITKMMADASLEDIHFNPGDPYWCALGRRGSQK